MPDEIAVFLGEHGKTTTLYESGRLTVFTRNMGKWSISREQSFSFDAIEDLRGLHFKLEEMLNFLKECRIFVGRTVNGIPYYLLEKANFSVWECEGSPREFLDYILEKEKYAEKEPSEKEMTTIPFTELTAGHFFISLTNIQKKHSGLTSKQVLQPFLRKGDFSTLEIDCSHTPLWLEAEMMTRGLQMTVSELGKNEVKVVITNRKFAE